jgi:hypothetical protein
VTKDVQVPVVNTSGVNININGVPGIFRNSIYIYGKVSPMNFHSNYDFSQHIRYVILVTYVN